MADKHRCEGRINDQRCKLSRSHKGPHESRRMKYAPEKWTKEGLAFLNRLRDATLGLADRTNNTIPSPCESNLSGVYDDARKLRKMIADWESALKAAAGDPNGSPALKMFKKRKLVPMDDDDDWGV